MSNRTLDRLKQRIRLDSKNGWIAGLCAGCANYFGTDPAFIRVGVVVTALFFPKIVIAVYLVGWLLIDDR
jgi:phage shock protein C